MSDALNQMKGQDNEKQEDQRSTFLKNTWIYNSWANETGSEDGQEEDNETEKHNSEDMVQTSGTMIIHGYNAELTEQAKSSYENISR